jgi:hypothetical protein
VAEVLVQFTDPVVTDDGNDYIARACGRELPDGRWEGWIEFLPVDGGEVLRSGRETTQPNRQDTMYWATGLTAVYLEGALHRALKPLTLSPEPPILPPVYDSPAQEPAAPPVAESILNPFSVYRKGEALLRRQLAALSPRHLINIIRAYGLSDAGVTTLNMMDEAALIEMIVSSVRTHVESSPTR